MQCRICYDLPSSYAVLVTCSFEIEIVSFSADILRFLFLGRLPSIVTHSWGDARLCIDACSMGLTLTTPASSSV